VKGRLLRDYGRASANSRGGQGPGWTQKLAAEEQEAGIVSGVCKER
jgi:hypothetical protein